MDKSIIKAETGEIVRHSMTPEQVQLLKDTIAKDSTDDELQMFLHIVNKTGLDPFSRQIHIIKRWDSSLNRKVATIQTGIDGYRVIADRTGDYAGQDEPKLTFREGKDIIPYSATVTVYRIIHGQRVGFTATAFWDEYVQTKKDGSLNSFWAKMPKGQLSKCAEALALRKAFPNDLSGLYTSEEMGQADNPTTLSVPKDDQNAERHEILKLIPEIIDLEKIKEITDKKGKVLTIDEARSLALKTTDLYEANIGKLNKYYEALSNQPEKAVDVEVEPVSNPTLIEKLMKLDKHTLLDLAIQYAGATEELSHDNKGTIANILIDKVENIEEILTTLQTQ